MELRHSAQTGALLASQSIKDKEGRNETEEERIREGNYNVHFKSRIRCITGDCRELYNR
jgi:hypothetical protein